MSAKRKPILGVLIVAFILSVMFIPTGAYTDVADGEWYTDAVNKWGDLIAEDDAVQPGKGVTRAEFAYILNQVLGFPEADPTFNDVADSPYKKAIGAFEAAGVVEGVGEGAYNPDGLLTRQEFVIFLGKALGLSQAPADKVPDFADLDEIFDGAKPWLYTMLEGGFVSGDPAGNFFPEIQLDRAQILAAINNAAAEYIDEDDAVVTLGEVMGNVIISAENVTLHDTIIRGNLIIAPGAGDSDLTLDSVHVEGSLVVRGGGANSIIITGTTAIKQIIIDKVTGSDAVRITVESEDATVELIVVGGSQDVVIDGSVAAVFVDAEVEVTIAGEVGELQIAAETVVTVEGTVESLTVWAALVEIIITEDAAVESLTLSGAAVGAVVENNGTIHELTVKAADAEIDNNGVIESAEIPVEVVITGTPAEEEVTIEAGSINDVYVAG
ncbi:MAG: S-layer homology domain-containing protein [Oscillospiraceae bacterium]|nr:S-layer homology domain-containing protein [Oscillospiraceae bacterium]